MRALLLASAALIAAPFAASLAAQDHSGHAGHTMPAQPADAEPELDHCAMGHLPPEQCPPKDEPVEDHSQHRMPAEDHAEMDHSTMDHSTMDHSKMDHSQHEMPEYGHAVMDHSQHQMPADEHAGIDHSQHQMSADEHAGMDHSMHDMGMDKSAPGAAPESAVPARALEGPRHAADLIYGEQSMARARNELYEQHGGFKTGSLMIERLEARFPTDGGDTGYVWDLQGWYGGDLNRFVVKSEGEGEFESGLSGDLDEAEIQALYSRAIGPYFDLQAGIRYDFEPDSRAHLVLGVQGLAPYMFHFDGALFLSDQADLTARVEAEYDQKITQRLILQPRIEIEASASDIPERDIAAGVTKVEPGLRLRYEIVREFAPYIGVEYEAKTFGTADIARAIGEDPDGLKLLLGVRAWF